MIWKESGYTNSLALYTNKNKGGKEDRTENPLLPKGV